MGCDIDFVKAGYDDSNIVNTQSQGNYVQESNAVDSGAFWGPHLKRVYADALEKAKNAGCEKCCYITIRITSTEKDPFFGEDIVVRYSCRNGSVTEVQNADGLNKHFK